MKQEELSNKLTATQYHLAFAQCLKLTLLILHYPLDFSCEWRQTLDLLTQISKELIFYLSCPAQWVDMIWTNFDWLRQKSDHVHDLIWHGHTHFCLMYIVKASKKKETFVHLESKCQKRFLIQITCNHCVKFLQSALPFLVPNPVQRWTYNDLSRNKMLWI